MKRKAKIEKRNDRVNQRIKKDEEMKKSINDSLNQFKLKDEVIRKKFNGGNKTFKED